MNKNDEIEVKNNVIFIDPNAQFGDSNIMKNVEDYCITVDLMVEVPGRTKGVNSDVFCLTWRSNINGKTENARFLQGTKISGENYLTDSYTNISFDSTKHGELIESIGIQSITIDYDSWYMPQVSITFIDLRGAALFNPSEYAEEDKSAPGSFFKAFFTFPYPMWKIQVKGFYGEPVTYRLHCLDSRYEFDSNVGNFVCNAKFVGYTYAFLADLQFDLIKSAPYITYLSKDAPNAYWSSKINESYESGGFKYDNLQPMDTLDRYLKKFDNITQDLKSISENDPNMQKFKQDNENHGKLQTILDLWRDLMIVIEENNKTNKSNYKNDISNFTISFDSDIDFSDITRTRNIYSQSGLNIRNELIKKIEEFNTSNNQNLLPYPGGDPQIIFQHTKKTEKTQNTGNEFTTTNTTTEVEIITTFNKVGLCKIGDLNGDPRVTLSNTITSAKNEVLTTNDVDKLVAIPLSYKSTIPINSYLRIRIGGGQDNEKEYKVVNYLTKEQGDNSLIVYSNQRKDYVSSNSIEVKKPLNLSTPSTINESKSNTEKEKNGKLDHSYKLDYSDFYKAVQKLSIEYYEESKLIKSTIQDQMNQMVISTLGFTPTVDNIMSLFFAHFETFMYNFYACVDKIRTRKVSDTTIRIEGTDIKLEGIEKAEDTNLPPFPLYAEIDSSGVMQETWIGRAKMKDGDDLEEVKLIYSIVEAIQTSLKIEQEIVQSSITKYSSWLPVNPYDNPIINKVQQSNPYDKFKTSSSLDDLSVQIILRMFYGLSLYSSKENDGNISKVLADADATNIFEALKGNELLERFGDNNISNTIRNVGFGKTADFTDSGLIPQLSDGNSADDKKLGTAIYQLNGNNLNYSFIKTGEGRKNRILPLFSDTINGYSNIFPQTTVDPTYQLSPAYINKFKETNGNYKAFFNGAFTITDDISVSELITYKSNIKEIELTNNWFLELEDSLKYLNAENISEKYDGIVNKSNYINYITAPMKKEDVFPRRLPSSSSGKINTDNNVSIVFDSSSYYNILNSGNNTSQKEILTNIRSNPSTEYHYPQISILDTKGIDTYESLFGSELFYNQNGGEKVGSLKKEAKAMLFLASFNYNEEEINKYFSVYTKTNSLQRIPKIVLLFIGSILKRLNYYESNKNIDGDKIDLIRGVEQKPYKYIKDGLSNTNSYNTNSFLTNIFPDIIGGTVDNPTIILSDPIKYQLITYFEEWVKDEFDCVLNQFEMVSYRNDTNELNPKPRIINLVEFKEIINAFKRANGVSINLVYAIFGNKGLMTYDRIIPVSEHGLRLFNRPDTNGVNYIIKLLETDVVMCSTGFIKDNKLNSDIKLSNSLVTSYIETLSSKVKELIGDKENAKIENKQNIRAYDNEDICLEMYKTLKNLYDKWFASKTFDYFTLTNFYRPQFTYIDKFYNKIGNKLILNVDIVKNLITDRGSGESRLPSFYSILSSLFSQHQMLLIPTPNFVDWGKYSEDFGKGIKDVLSDVFTPKPWSDKSVIYDRDTLLSQFTGIYVGTPSYSLDIGGNYNYKNDGTDFRDPTFMTSSSSSENDQYKLPCFAVSFGVQNQSIFKKLQLNTANPVNTDQAIAAIVNLTNNTNGKQHVAQGQDLFSIYSKNSYQAEIEMMGCAQIQPLMYFQLMNVPMWNGAYMIFKMSHQIEPGNMTTKIKGMRMSRLPVKLTDKAFSYEGYFEDLILKPLVLGKDIYDNSYKEMGQITLDSSGGININESSGRVINSKASNYTSGGKFIYGGGIRTNLDVADKIIDEDHIGKGNYEKIKTQPLYKNIKLTIQNVVESGTGNKLGTGSYTKAGDEMPQKCLAYAMVLAPNVIKIQNLLEKEGCSMIFTSWWRHKDHEITKTTNGYHQLGCAIDFEIYDKKKKANIRDDEGMKAIFKKIYDMLGENNITEFLRESSKSGKRWFHYSYCPASTKHLINDSYKA